MALILASKARHHFSEPGVTMDLRTFRRVAEQYRLKKHAVGSRIKYDEDEIKRKLKMMAK